EGKTLDTQHSTLNAETSFDPFSYQRRATKTIERDGMRLGGEQLIRVLVRQENFGKIAHKIDKMGDYKPEIVYENAQIQEIDPREDAAIAGLNQKAEPQFVTVKDDVDLPVIAAFRLLAARVNARHPILLKDTLCRVVAKNDEIRMTNDETNPNAQMTKDDSGLVIPSGFDIRASSFLHTLLTASTNIGSLLCDGIGDAVLVQGEQAPGQALRLSYNILQAAGSRIFKTDYVACPSCGRTLLNLQTTTAKIK